MKTEHQKRWSKERREAQRQRRLGTTWSASVRRKMARSSCGQVPWNAGKHHSTKTKKKISSALSGRSCHWAKGKTYEEMYGVDRAKQLKRERSIALTGIKRSKVTRNKLVVARAKKVIPFKDSRPEKAVAAFLVGLGVKFEQHGLIANSSHQFDVLVRKKKLAIEVDGCWWHGCRECGVILSQAAREQRARDRWWEKKAKKAGWTVIRIWEHDIRVGDFTVLREALGTAQRKGVSHGESSFVG